MTPQPTDEARPPVKPGEPGWFQVVDLGGGQVGVLGDSDAYWRHRQREDASCAAARREAVDGFCAELRRMAEPLERAKRLPKRDPRREFLLYRVEWRQARALAARWLQSTPRPARTRSRCPGRRVVGQARRAARRGVTRGGPEDDPHPASPTLRVAGAGR